MKVFKEKIRKSLSINILFSEKKLESKKIQFGDIKVDKRTKNIKTGHRGTIRYYGKIENDKEELLWICIEWHEEGIGNSSGVKFETKVLDLKENQCSFIDLKNFVENYKIFTKEEEEEDIFYSELELNNEKKNHENSEKRKRRSRSLIKFFDKKERSDKLTTPVSHKPSFFAKKQLKTKEVRFEELLYKESKIEELITPDTIIKFSNEEDVDKFIKIITRFSSETKDENKTFEKKYKKFIKFNKLLKYEEEELRNKICRTTKVIFLENDETDNYIKLFISIFSKSMVYDDNNIFGISLSDVMKRPHESTHLVPKILLDMINYLILNTPKVRGVFRENGSKKNIEILYNDLIFNNNTINTKKSFDFTSYELLSITSLFKQYLRELPEPLLTFDEYDNFLGILKIENEEGKINKITEIMERIPIHNRYLLYYLFTLIIKISENKSENLMGIDNLAVVFTPNILNPRLGSNVDLSKIQNANTVLVQLINLYPSYFLEFDDFKIFLFYFEN
jgi:hypothetical protein